MSEKEQKPEGMSPGDLRKYYEDFLASLSEKNKQRLDEFLGARDWQAVQVALLELEGAIIDFESKFAVSLFPEPMLKPRVQWLIHNSSKLEWIADQVSGNLISHPALDIHGNIFMKMGLCTHDNMIVLFYRIFPAFFGIGKGLHFCFPVLAGQETCDHDLTRVRVLKQPAAKPDKPLQRLLAKAIIPRPGHGARNRERTGPGRNHHTVA